jgi:hydrogenase-4 component B
MALVLAAVAIQVLCGLAALIFRKDDRMASLLGVAGPVIACIIGLIPAIQALTGASIPPVRFAWSMPLGSFSIGLDGLSAIFLLPILGVGALAAVYGHEYLRSYRTQKSIGCSWFLYNILCASMVMVVLARNALLFLTAWEVMSLSSFFLVAFEYEKKEVREASWIYLIATHLGTAFLLALFLLLGRAGNGLDFDRFGAGGLTSAFAALCFILALIGFGTKAGILPFHVWLPEAHPAAPSHVSALMSGVMIKTGIYGILRILTFLGPPPAWWGFALVGIGLLSGVIGVLFALAQHDLKKLLAYHSVENIGIIVMGIGVGILGISSGSMPLAVFGFAGGLLHVVNHALFKSLLFMGAGSVAHGAHTREIDHLGGLIKRMPWTAAAFLIGSVAISGLPPLNGFVSEFLIYFGAFQGASSLENGVGVAMLAVIAGLALIGGLAVACFTKAYGIVFLGEPRSDHPQHAQESGKAILYPMGILSAACAASGLLGFLIVPALTSALNTLIASGHFGENPVAVYPELIQVSGYLKSFSLGALLFLLLIGAIVLFRRWLISGRTIRKAGTWDCGYAQPTARMQYTASSFAQPVVDFFDVFQHGRKRFKPPQGFFPANAFFETETLDTSQEGVYRPIFEAVRRMLSKLRIIQHGRMQLYVLYIVLTLIVLLIWKLR